MTNHSESQITKNTDSKIEVAETLFGISYSPEERSLMVEIVENQLKISLRRRSLELKNNDSPALLFYPHPPGYVPRKWDGVQFSPSTDLPLPSSAADIAFAPIHHQVKWLRSRQLSSRKLTEVYLDRIYEYSESLECMVTVTADLALQQADIADDLFKEGTVCSPLQGIPYVIKDLLDVAGVPTTWGAEFHLDYKPTQDAKVYELLRNSGAVMLGKASLGALAMGDIWHRGQTRNPWNRKEGSTGSSAGSAAAVGAGLCAFGIGSETLGSIQIPSQRCGAVGLRPTFGRVSRRGAMALCWSLDKIGPICRSSIDTGLVLESINRYDPADLNSVDYSFTAPGMDESVFSIGYMQQDFESSKSNPAEIIALDNLRSLGHELVPIHLPDLPWDAMMFCMYAEAASAFEMITLNDIDDSLKRQDQWAWPNIFRCARFISAIDYIQGDRIRRKAMDEMRRVFTQVDIIVAPILTGPMLMLTNFTGHPSICLRSGFIQSGTRSLGTILGGRFEPPVIDSSDVYRVPQGISLIGRMFEEERLIVLADQLEQKSGIAAERPNEFS